MSIQFTAPLGNPAPTDRIGAGVLLSVPEEVSQQLPSRGMVMVSGTINGAVFTAALEPDGNGSHWFRVDTLPEAGAMRAGEIVDLAITPLKDWPEPRVPTDWADALAADPVARAAWEDVTPAARWDWIRWIGATRNPETRQRRIEVGCSKLRSGKRRPCCFDRSQCTLTEA